MKFSKTKFILFLLLAGVSFSSCTIEKYLIGSKAIELPDGKVRRNMILSDAKKIHYAQLEQEQLKNRTQEDINQFLESLNFGSVPPPCEEIAIWGLPGFKFIINERPFQETILESEIVNEKSQVIMNMKNKINLNKGNYRLIRMRKVNENFHNSQTAIWKIRTKDIGTNRENIYSFKVKLK